MKMLLDLELSSAETVILPTAVQYAQTITCAAALFLFYLPFGGMTPWRRMKLVTHYARTLISVATLVPVIAAHACDVPS